MFLQLQRRPSLEIKLSLNLLIYRHTGLEAVILREGKLTFVPRNCQAVKKSPRIQNMNENCLFHCLDLGETGMASKNTRSRSDQRPH